MIRRSAILWHRVAAAAAAACAQAPNALTPEERAAGWTLLFDGKTTDRLARVPEAGVPRGRMGRRRRRAEVPGPQGRRHPDDGDVHGLRVRLGVEALAEGEHGREVFVDERRGNATGAIGHEYQMIDDEGYDAEPLSAKQKTGGVVRRDAADDGRREARRPVEPVAARRARHARRALAQRHAGGAVRDRQRRVGRRHRGEQVQGRRRATPTRSRRRSCCRTTTPWRGSAT